MSSDNIVYDVREKGGAVDEVVCDRVGHFHMEQMDAGHWWIGLTLKDGTLLHIRMHSKKKIVVTVERDEP